MPMRPKPMWHTGFSLRDLPITFRLACSSLSALAHPRPKNWALFCIRRRPEQDKKGGHAHYALTLSHAVRLPCSSVYAYLTQVPTIEPIEMQPEPCIHREKPPAWFFALPVQVCAQLDTFVQVFTYMERLSSAHCATHSGSFHSSRREHASESQTACRLEPYSQS